MKKGIVISPCFEPIHTGGIRILGTPDEKDIRKYLLYWDEIDYPSNKLIDLTSDDIEYLEDIKILKRTPWVPFSEPGAPVRFHSNNGEFFVAAQEAAFRANEENEPGCWDIAQLSEVPFYTSQYISSSIEMEMHDMLPVPCEDTPLDDILNFKEKRRDELIAFRIYMNELNEKIISSDNIPRIKNTSIAHLDLAIRDIDKTIKESGIRRIATNFKQIINLDLSDMYSAGLGGAGVSQLIGTDPLATGVASAGILIAVKSLILPGRQCSSKFSYIDSVKRNF
ncbi:DUF6236 family protein [Aeromonas salmonicida]|uniref:DUF6236 family protein n=1 Tax=Aeromonas salmonicida TaxID=645 RepID=A0AAX3VS87_AERSA|nr:DUF6236 family protein [Aeromonas salmonicida]WHF36816.1 DUF6236 family protein [Aeromonas salmonicida]